MGKSGGRKKKGGSNLVSVDNNSSNTTAHANGGVDLDSSIFFNRGHELKEEGNKKFQNRDYMAAFQHYDNALRLIPKTHPDRAVFNNNKAVCLMQMKPIDYDTVIAECTMALQVQPRFVRALLRRARAFEAIVKYEMAMQDVQLLFGADPNHKDALEIARRLRTALGPRQKAQQDLQSCPSPAALGASAVRGAPVAGIGSCLPARPVPKKTAASPPAGSAASPSNKLEKHQMTIAAENSPENKAQFPRLMLKPSSESLKATDNLNKDSQREQSLFASLRGQLQSFKRDCEQTFSFIQSVLIKYKDSDGDLVTITCTNELRMAESSVDTLIPIESEADKTSGFGVLRLHIVEVSPEQEPPLSEEEEEKPLESEEAKADESGSHSSLGDTMSEGVDTEIEKTEKEASKEKVGALEDQECKEVEMDDWLFEFAQLFRTHVGIDPDAHIDLHELGMELCSEALEETVTNESAGKEVVSAKLQVAYDWVREKYSLAREKYAEALLIKPFEMAKLNCSFSLAQKIDLSSWDPAETLLLFDSAEEKMKAATEMWEKLEEQRVNELKDPNSNKEEELKRRKKPGSGAERMDGWKKNLDTAVERFKLAGASEADISTVLKNHCSKGDAVEGDPLEFNKNTNGF
ncbi:hypothetical protein CRYUN_Cryun25bG0002200 [Craigia yunnanensis]